MGNGVLVQVESSQLRSWGRQALRGRWKLALAGTLLYMILATLPILIFTMMVDSQEGSWISNLYTFLVTGPLMLGYTVFMIQIFRKKPTSPGQVFYGFESFGKAFSLFFVMNFFILLWSLLFIIPGIIASYRYAMVFYILADNPNIGVMQAMEESKRLMFGNKWKLFCLELSFLGWILLSVLAAGLGFIVLLPYMTESTVAFYEVAKGNLRIHRPLSDVPPLNQESFPEER